MKNILSLVLNVGAKKKDNNLILEQFGLTET